MGIVALQACPNYEQAQVESSLHAALEAVGGIGAFVKVGQRVLLKVNLVIAHQPEKASTTHPALVRALAKEVQSVGGHPVIGDSPGGPYTASWLRIVYERSGMARVAQELGCALNQDFSTRQIPLEGKKLREMEIISCAMDCDVLISVGKLKTHGLMVMTGCAKNLFGLVPGTHKAQYHFRYPENKDFTDALVDICQAGKPALNVLDAITIMEGEGPTGGSPRQLGAIVCGANPYEVDTIGAQLLGLTQGQQWMQNAAIERGLLVADAIEVAGMRAADLALKGADIPPGRDPGSMMKSHPILMKIATPLMRQNPVLIKEKCNGCATCAKACPATCIEMIDKKPRIKRKECIRCFCCQELCPQSAMDIKRSWLTRVFR